MTDEVSIVVASYRRVDRLRDCLRAIETQTRSVTETIVVHRHDDEPTREMLRSHPRVTPVSVREPGVLAAMRAGAAASRGIFVAFVDDDVVLCNDWVERCLAHLSANRVGGVGGRDLVRGDEDGPAEPDPGRITRWGKLRGDHHLGVGPPRDVDVLKAANVLFRRDALWLPTALRGGGAQPHFEVAMSLASIAEGWRLVFDPGIQVAHYPARRFDADQRGAPSPGAVRDASYNLVRCLCAMRPEVTVRRAVYGLALGDRAVPGIGRALVAVMRRETDVIRKLLPSLVGQLEALGETAFRRSFPMTGFARPEPAVDRSRVK